ncbi:MAG: hypothetical protein J5934_08910 [Succinivibrio sp.]|nr:hypothetical protein [Succinivibrio sp.]
MWFGHLHSTKEVPYGLFILHVQLDSTIGQQYYIEKMMEIADMANEKNSEGKAFLWKVVAVASSVASVAIALGAAALTGGRLDLNLPHK